MDRDAGPLRPAVVGSRSFGVLRRSRQAAGPDQLAAVSQILLDLLELRQHVSIVSPMDVSRKKHLPRIDQLARQWVAGFDQRRVQTLQNVRVGLEGQADEPAD